MHFFTYICVHSSWLSKSFIDIQLVWFSKLEPKSVLQHKLDLSGDVAAKHPRDLWGPEESQLSWQDDRANETEIPQIHGWQGTDNIPDQGDNSMFFNAMIESHWCPS